MARSNFHQLWDAAASSLLVKFTRFLYEDAIKENHRIILDMVEENSNAKVLDCGCHSGELTKEIGGKIASNDLCGIEIVNKFAQMTEQKGIKIYQADLNGKFPFEDETFDVVLANQVIEHLYNTDVFIKEIWRVLKRGGTP